MAIEIYFESYLFTCVRCTTRWAESYQVSQAIDDAGTIRCFYRNHGVPCAAPVRGNVECPNCHRHQGPGGTPPTGMLPDFDPEEAEAHPAGRAPTPDRRRGAPPYGHPASGRRHLASVKVLGRLHAGRGRTTRTAVPERRSRAHGPRAVLPHGPTEAAVFPRRRVYTDDDRPLRPGDRGVRVIVSVPDDDASGYFESGQRFTVWDRTDIGHGTVAERLFFQWR